MVDTRQVSCIYKNYKWRANLSSYNRYNKAAIAFTVILSIVHKANCLSGRVRVFCLDITATIQPWSQNSVESTKQTLFELTVVSARCCTLTVQFKSLCASTREKQCFKFITFAHWKNNISSFRISKKAISTSYKLFLLTWYVIIIFANKASSIYRYNTQTSAYHLTSKTLHSIITGITTHPLNFMTQWNLVGRAVEKGI